jgi:hypothetical protein
MMLGRYLTPVAWRAIRQRYHAGSIPRSILRARDQEFISCLKEASVLHATVESELHASSGQAYNDTARFLSVVGPLVDGMETVLCNELLWIELEQMSKEDEDMAALAVEGILSTY